MESIFLIIQIIERSYSGYDYYPEEYAYVYQGTHSGNEHEVLFHSAHTTMQEASEVLDSLWDKYEAIRRRYNPEDITSPISYTEYSGFMIKELHAGQELERMRF